MRGSCASYPASRMENLGAREVRYLAPVVKLGKVAELTLDAVREALEPQTLVSTCPPFLLSTQPSAMSRHFRESRGLKSSRLCFLSKVCISQGPWDNSVVRIQSSGKLPFMRFAGCTTDGPRAPESALDWEPWVLGPAFGLASSPLFEQVRKSH